MTRFDPGSTKSACGGAVLIAVAVLYGASAGVAAPLASGVRDAASVRGAAAVERIVTRCTTRDGRRVCREVEPPANRADRRDAPARNSRDEPTYYEHDANKLPFGSSRWWDQMMREDRAGHCCG